MCGIAGFFSEKKIFSQGDLEMMTSSLYHRGPDAGGYFNEGPVGLGHRRLSIIDLSSHANQPMHSHCGRYVIAYNGEIYNFKEIAADLHINCKTTSDTEVILEAFAKEGTACVNRFNGMFAIAIYDRSERQLFLFRDRMGIKPLFYYYNGADFAFASELKALMQLKQVKTVVKTNPDALTAYLHLGYIPEPHTIYNNIYKFPAGKFAIIKQEPEFHTYWKLEDKILPGTIGSFNEAKQKLNELLTQSVRYRLISDVPYGVFLSGGIDSSLITAVAQKVSTAPIKTFSIGFKEAKYNEANYAKAVAQYLKTDHHEFIVSHTDAMELIESLPDIYDEPYTDSSAIPTMLVSKLARQYVTMTLSGDGGDELFHGYGAYTWAGRLSNPLVKAFRKPAGMALSLLSDRHKRAATLFNYPSELGIMSHIFSQEQLLFSQAEIGKLLVVSHRQHVVPREEYRMYKRNLSPAERQAMFDLRYYLKDDLLVKVDRASMKYSLETRVPYLDYRIVELAINIDPRLKTPNGVQKYLLKELLYDYIPRSYFDRPKWGFSIPLAQWLKTDLRYLVDNYLSEEIISQQGIIRYDVVRNLKDAYFGGRTYLYNRLWTLIVLGKWMEKQ